MSTMHNFSVLLVDAANRLEEQARGVNSMTYNGELETATVEDWGRRQQQVVKALQDAAALLRAAEQADAATVRPLRLFER